MAMMVSLWRARCNRSYYCSCYPQPDRHPWWCLSRWEKDYRLSELEKKVDKHNNVVERMYEVEKKLALIKDQQQEITERVENLEKDAHAALNN